MKKIYFNTLILILSIISLEVYSQPGLDNPENCNIIIFSKNKPNYLSGSFVKPLTKSEFYIIEEDTLKHSEEELPIKFVDILEIKDTLRFEIISDRGLFKMLLINNDVLKKEEFYYFSIYGFPDTEGTYVVELHKSENSKLLNLFCFDITPENWENVKIEK